MLHILLLILKIIGIILAVILGILVLLICIVLFIPVRYKGTIHCDGTMESFQANGKVTWLFPLIVVIANYKDKELHYSARIAWKRIRDGEETTVPEETPPQTSSEQVLHQPCKEAEPGIDRATHSARPIKEKKQEINQQIKENIFVKLIQQWKQMWEKMKCTITSFCAKIKVLSQKKEKMLAFIYNETHQKAFQKVKIALFVLLKKWRPQKVRADIIFGFEDPYYTGQVLAGLGVIYPFLWKSTSITPDFEQSIFKGNINIKGKLAMVHLISLCWKLFWCKAVRRTYKDIKNFK